MQRFTSACTSINSTKLPSVFKKVNWRWMLNEKKNLDYGGGKFDNATQYLREEFGISNYVYDPYNRTNVHNRLVLDEAPFDSATLSNVLNVVMEKEVRLGILTHMKSLLRANGKAYITVYQGNLSGVAKVNEKRNSCQLNKPLKDYVDEVLEVFENAEIKNGMIIAW